MIQRILTLAVLAGLACAGISCGTRDDKMAQDNAIAGKPVVLIQTSEGDIKVELWPHKAPATVKNFLAYVREGFYDGTIFHRVIKGFMIQGGGFTADMSQKKTRTSIRNEAREDVKNEEGTIAMARTNDPHSATAQFFINTSDKNDFLNRNGANWGYAVFGKVAEGMDVVKKIEQAQTTGKGGQPMPDMPAKTVTIKSITLLEK